METIFFRKFIVKALDFILLYTVLSLGALALPFSIEDAIYLYLLALTPLIWIPLEIIFFLTWGSTPGGAFLGIAPLPVQGGSLSFMQAVQLSLFCEKKNDVRWMPHTKKIGRLLSRLALGATVLIGAIFGKAVFQFPEEFERTFSSEKSWMEYTQPEGNFTAVFPAEPIVNEKQFPIPQAKSTLDYSEYRSDEKKASYSIGVLELPRKWRIFGSGTILKGALKVLLDNTKNAKLISKTSTKHGKHPALNFHMRESDKEIKGRLILVGGKLYKVEFAQKYNADEEEKGFSFIESFTPNP